MVFWSSLRFRVLLVFSSLIVAGVVAGLLVVEDRYQGIAETRLKSMAGQHAESVAFSLDSLFDRLAASSRTALSGDAVQRFLAASDPFSDPALSKAAQRQLQEMLGNSREIHSVHVIDREGHGLHVRRNAVLSSRPAVDEGIPWVRATRAARGGAVFFGPSFRVFGDDDGFPTLTCARLVNDLNLQKPVGFVVVVVSLEVIGSYLDPGAGPGAFMEFLDGEGRPVLETGTPPEAGARRVEAERRLPESGWTVRASVPTVPLPSEADFRPVLMLLVVGLGLVSILAAMLVSSMIRRPVYSLLASMDRDSGGVPADAPSTGGIAEFRRLTEGYNRLLARIRALMAATVRDQALLRERELALLFAQLKPHFLYNTLDSVSALALLGRGDDVRRMVTALGSFYRICLSGGRDLIPLSDELDIIRHYEVIQRIRYDDLFSVRIEVPEELLDSKVPRLLLQPLVENALYHGIRPTGRKGRIDVAAAARGDALEVTVADDGAGFGPGGPPDPFAAEAVREDGGIGLRATAQRLRALYGELGAIEAREREGGGAVVVVTLPREAYRYDE